MTHRSHVPKFGNWDGDDEQYTACFETARREKDLTTMTMVNPNDPEQNPEAFNFLTGAAAAAAGDGSVSRNSNSSSARSGRRRNLSHQRSRESYGSLTPAESVSSRSNYSDHSVLQRCENKRIISKGGSVGHTGSFSSSSNHRRGSGSHSSRDYENQKGTAIPKFGEWDEEDPKSGESFTVIFSKLKQEKHAEPGHLPDAPPQLVHFSDVHHQRHRPSHKTTRSKNYCCFFK
ncbi:RPM1-interacting protein 4-like isoform X2 [Prosopis cineraria]|uniref:RPM1-interacting protein 4-like isoform X2 n=1 Tax=Prosopis cineraria TaxID=364024 RepID=UPI002410B4E5|nr:RPM1-interacting protein 4-like isoform X2 [Prosopis cineraria]